jgi:hypothetical protein
LHPSFSFSPSAARLSLCRNKVCYICVCLCLYSSSFPLESSVVSREIVSHRCLGGGGGRARGESFFFAAATAADYSKALGRQVTSATSGLLPIKLLHTLLILFFSFLSLLLTASLVCAGRDISNCLISHTAIVCCSLVLNTKKKVILVLWML